MWCENCESTNTKLTTKYSRAFDRKYGDHELTQDELIDRCNGDKTYIVECLDCGHVYETI